jgi:hypothetical protein
LDLNDRHISALTNRATVYEQIGDKETQKERQKEYFQKALHDLQQAKEIEPQNNSFSESIARIKYKISL